MANSALPAAGYLRKWSRALEDAGADSSPKPSSFGAC